jgi:hypothetical protein
VTRLPLHLQHCDHECVCQDKTPWNSNNHPCEGCSCEWDTRSHTLSQSNVSEQIRNAANALSSIITLEPNTAKELTHIESDLWDIANKLDKECSAFAHVVTLAENARVLDIIQKYNRNDPIECPSDMKAGCDTFEGDCIDCVIKSLRLYEVHK